MSNKIDNIKELFFFEPKRKYHIREIARILKVAPTTATKYLNSLVQVGFLFKKEERNHILFSIGNHSIVFNEKKMFNIKRIEESGLIEFLVEEFHPEVIILFGSTSKGTNIDKSDIDLFIISEKKIKVNLEKFKMKLKSEIQLFCHNRKDFEEMKVTNKNLLNNVINGDILYGFIEAF